MKKIYLLFGILILLVSCNTKKEETPNIIQEQEKTIADTHNAQNSLDYIGTYKGTLPTASGMGMNVTIILSDSSYSKMIEYIGQEGIHETSGRYSWNTNGSIITFTGEELPNQYFVGENTLYHLDMDGNRITGELADKYILHKQ